MKTLFIIGQLWNDGANTYHSAEIILDNNLPTEKRYYLPFHYGYERQFIYNSIKLLQKVGELPEDANSVDAVKQMGIDLDYTATKCRKKDLYHLKKFKCSFKGRLNTSIGKTYKIKDFIQAVNEDEARKELYNKYEHISELIIK